MSNDSTLYTVGDVARRFAVTVRTLRHWEALGLLSPAQRSWSNYRLYSAGDCARVQRIIIYRATGMKLGDIKTLLDSGESGVSHLKRQRASLIAHRQQTDKMIAAIDTLLEDAMNENSLSVEEIGEILGDADFAAHQEEAQQRYGGSDDWQESQRRTASWTAKDWQGNADRFQQVEKDMITAIRQGVLPDSDEAAALVASHRELLGEFFPVTPAKHYVISRSYIHDERFRSHYDSQLDGFAWWLASAIECAARDSGVDTDNPEWV